MNFAPENSVVDDASTVDVSHLLQDIRGQFQVLSDAVSSMNQGASYLPGNSPSSSTQRDERQTRRDDRRQIRQQIRQQARQSFREEDQQNEENYSN